jgi:hypothetical protein
VTYVVSGSTADVTYGPSGSSFSHKVPMNVSKPLGSPQYYSISAQLQGGGHVSCELKVNGKTLSKASASGSYNIAMCEIVQDPISDQRRMDRRQPRLTGRNEAAPHPQVSGGAPRCVVSRGR